MSDHNELPLTKERKYRLALSDFKTNCEVTIIKREWHWQMDKNKD